MEAINRVVLEVVYDLVKSKQRYFIILYSYFWSLEIFRFIPIKVVISWATRIWHADKHIFHKFLNYWDNFIIICCCSVAQLCLTLRPQGLQHARLPCPSPSRRVCSNPFHSVGDAIQPYHPLSPPSPPAPNLSSIRVFSSESTLHIRWPKCWSFSFSISPSNEYSGFISFMIKWYDLLEVQGTLKSLLQHHSSKASILGHSTFFMIQLPHPYMTTGKNIALARWTFVDKVMSLLFDPHYHFFYSPLYFNLLKNIIPRRNS